MNQSKEAIINPIKGKNSPDVGPVAVMVSSSADISLMAKSAPGEAKWTKLFMSRVYPQGCLLPPGASVAGPFMGAPYAVMLLENLIAWGAGQIIFFGWCGAIDPLVKAGDIILPTGAIRDEGTSGHYEPQGSMATPPGNLGNRLGELLESKKISHHRGAVWSTDAIFRETYEKIDHFRRKEALAVEMELSAVLTVARFRKVEAAGILVVSDELSGDSWRPGFKNPKFKEARLTALEVIRELCPRLIP